MDHIFIFILVSLAVYRLALMVSKETGPCRVFERIRAIPKPNGCWSKGLSCFYCQSVWWAYPATVWLWMIGVVPWTIFMMYWLGISGMAVLIYQFGPKLE